MTRPWVATLAVPAFILSSPGCGTMVTNASLAHGSDDLPLVAFGLSTLDPRTTPPTAEEVLRVAHCEDPTCATFSQNVIDPRGGWDISLAIGADGRGLISYTGDGHQLLIAHCADVACTRAATHSLGDAAFPSDTSLAIGADGLGLLSYRHSTSGSLRVAHCEDAACTRASLTEVEAGGFKETTNSLVIGADGLGLIAYAAASSDGSRQLRIAHCSDAPCGSASLRTLAEGYGIRFAPAAVIRTDGLALVPFTQSKEGLLRVAHCLDVECARFGLSTVGSAGEYSGFTSVVIGSDGLALISYAGPFYDELHVAHCADIACTSIDSTATLDRGSAMRRTSLALGRDGLARIAYGIGGSARLARCLDVRCTRAEVTTYDRTPD